MVKDNTLLTPRWYPLIHHPQHDAWWNSKARFCIVPAGRRSGKTEIGKRRLVTKALSFCEAPNGRFVAGAPTHKQAKRIYWQDLKAMVPRELLCPWMRKPISESELTIHLYNGARIEVCGLDVPERMEGDPLDHILLDEYGNVKKDAWDAHIMPGLFTLGRPPGTGDLIGVPEGRNHYYKTYQRAVAGLENWEAFTWKSSDILPPEQIRQAKGELDPLTYAQEYEASFVTFAGRAYYQYSSEHNTEQRLIDYYDDEAPLILCFDFNVDPGVCVICQEVEYEGSNANCADRITAVIDEVHIVNNSNTLMVCDKILKKYRKHKGLVKCYGDPAGGARGTAKINGNDWELIKSCLVPYFDERLKFDVGRSAPSERIRLNCVNSRISSTNGTIRLLVDPLNAVKTSEDLEGVRTDEQGHIDKKSDMTLTHLSDALGYYIERSFPISCGRVVRSQQI